jgi:hypothetical protein
VNESPVVASVVSPQGRNVELTEERWRYIQRHVELTEERWRYIQRHVEMSGRRDELLEATRQPDLQEPDPRPGASATGCAAVRPFPSVGCG